MIVLPFAELASRVQAWYREDQLSHQQIADRLETEQIAPALGHASWSWRAVDAVLVLSASQRQALDKEAQ